jgi:hypothetical protein
LLNPSVPLIDHLLLVARICKNLFLLKVVISFSSLSKILEAIYKIKVPRSHASLLSGSVNPFLSPES